MDDHPPRNLEKTGPPRRCRGHPSATRSSRSDIELQKLPAQGPEDRRKANTVQDWHLELMRQQAFWTGGRWRGRYHLAWGYLRDASNASTHRLCVWKYVLSWEEGPRWVATFPVALPMLTEGIRYLNTHIPYQNAVHLTKIIVVRVDLVHCVGIKLRLELVV